MEIIFFEVQSSNKGDKLIKENQMEYRVEKDRCHWKFHWRGFHYFFRAAVTNHYKPHGLKQQKFAVSFFWGLEIWSQAVGWLCSL